MDVSTPQASPRKYRCSSSWPRDVHIDLLGRNERQFVMRDGSHGHDRLSADQAVRATVVLEGLRRCSIIGLACAWGLQTSKGDHFSFRQHRLPLQPSAVDFIRGSNHLDSIHDINQDSICSWRNPELFGRT
nr:hypothetical protein CFP56_00374 [Quercus suber]